MSDRLGLRTFVGLDPGTKLGWGRIEEQADGSWLPVSWGLEDFSPKTGDPEGVRFRRVADWLPSVLGGVDAVGIEHSVARAQRAAAIGAGIVAIILVELERREIEYAFAAPSTLKKYATGYGGSKKNPVSKEDVRATLDGWGSIGPETDMALDTSDALVAARWLADTYSAPIEEQALDGLGF